MMSFLFSGRFMVDKQDDGYAFVDRDPELFRRVLAYLRDGEGGVEVPEEEGERNALLREAEFYALPELKEKILACSLPTESIYVVGGRGGGVLASVERYHPSVGQWEQCASMPSGRACLAAASVGSHLFAIGGVDDEVGVTLAFAFTPLFLECFIFDVMAE